MTKTRKQIFNRSYQKTMDDMRQKLSPKEQTFSHILHSKAGSGLYQILANYILRPRSALIGASMAIIGLLASYLIARLHGYTPSGSEPALGFAMGWSIGIIYDAYMHLSAKAKRLR